MPNRISTTLATAIAMLIAAPGLAQTGAQTGAQTEGERERPWSLSLTGGITAVQNQADQPFGGIALQSNFGASYGRVGVTYVSSGDTRGLTIPADTWIGNLGFGTAVGALALDGYVNYGRRSFAPARLQGRAGNLVNLDRSGNLFGVGGSLTYDIALSDRLFVSPYAGIDYNSIDFAVAVLGAGGAVVGSARDRDDGVTGTAGVALSQLFAGDGGSLSVAGAFSSASNIAAVGQLGTRQGSSLPRFVGAGAQGDSWGEVSGTLSLNLSNSIAADLSVIQTIDFAFGDTTAGSLTLRFAF